ncbi:hypothetical protein DPMN_028735 [Dreissena polymorpha]|uniref:Uncharacterized protein n=1 Tax=Dreissena polymorpha TaxID=45954 RepID=A0A9D4RFM0_DREPO|nr:hypothetical protein DPMN_028735 [Dreissena polymorpha]
MTRAFSGAISGGGSGPDTIALNAANRIIENIKASGDINKPSKKLINLRDVVKKRQQRNGSRANAELNSKRVGMENERSQAQGQKSEPAVAERDFHNKNCFKLGQICGFNETPAPRAIQNTAQTHRCAALGFPAAEISSEVTVMGTACRSATPTRAKRMQTMYKVWQR